MITHLTGKILMKSDKFLVIDVNGAGYKVFASPDTLTRAPQKNEQISLWTHLHVKEDALDLYGFFEHAELSFFEQLIQISGIGPKSALGVLAIAPLDTIKKAVASGQTDYLTKVSGIGRKTAEKIILELRDKMGASHESDSLTFKEDQDVLAAMEAIGYSKQEAREALKQVPDEITGTNSRIKEALRKLGGGK